MFGEYDQVNFGNDLTIKTKDALFYYQLGRGMYDSGFRNFDSISVDTYLSDKADTRKVFSAYGGYLVIFTCWAASPAPARPLLCLKI